MSFRSERSTLTDRSGSWIRVGSGLMVALLWAAAAPAQVLPVEPTRPRLHPGASHPGPYYSRAMTAESFPLKPGQRPLYVKLAPYQHYGQHRLGEPWPLLADGTVKSDLFAYRYHPGFVPTPRTPAWQASDCDELDLVRPNPFTDEETRITPEASADDPTRGPLPRGEAPNRMPADLNPERGGRTPASLPSPSARPDSARPGARAPTSPGSMERGAPANGPATRSRMTPPSPPTPVGPTGARRSTGPRSGNLAASPERAPLPSLPAKRQ